jgi:hypothetical protein
MRKCWNAYILRTFRNESLQREIDILANKSQGIHLIPKWFLTFSGVCTDSPSRMDVVELGFRFISEMG